jgi:hypothetical protein
MGKTENNEAGHRLRMRIAGALRQGRVLTFADVIRMSERDRLSSSTVSTIVSQVDNPAFIKETGVAAERVTFGRGAHLIYDRNGDQSKREVALTRKLNAMLKEKETSKSKWLPNKIRAFAKAHELHKVK